MKLTKQDLLRHLELALSGQPEHLREKVEHVVSLCQRHTKLPAVPQRNVLFSNGKTARREYWDVELCRKDAKFVEEVWADFMARKKLHGTWRTATVKGQLSPVARDIDTGQITFRFLKVPDTIRIPEDKDEKKKEKPTLATTKESVKKMSKEQQVELLKILLARKRK